MKKRLRNIHENKKEDKKRREARKSWRVKGDGET